MRKGLKLCALLAAATLVFGCASKQESQGAGRSQVSVKELSPSYSTAEVDPAKGHAVVQHAKKHLGTPYVRGGSQPGGFDCSGFVMWAYNRVGVELPRTAREQSAVGQKIHKVEDMRAGDIVAFNHPKRGYHTGIYVGDGKFIHSPRKKSHVKINSLDDPYFNKTLLGARRVNFDGSENLIAQAKNQLEESITRPGLNALANKNTKAQKNFRSKQAIAKKQNTKAIASKTSKKATVASKTAKTNKNTALAAKSAKKSKTASLASKTVKAPVKTLANHDNKAKGSATAKASPKKSQSKAVSLLQQKSNRKAVKTGKRS